MHYFLLVLSLLPFYAIGTIPVGLLIARTKGIDILHSGSGNVGATNVARSVGKSAGFFTLIGDVLKGVFAVQLGYLVGGAEYSELCAVAAVAGHCFAIPKYLKGGKGVATSLGALLGLQPELALIALGIFGSLFSVFRIVSIGSLGAGLGVPLAALFMNVSTQRAWCLLIIGAIIFIRHRSNINRLINLEEPKFSFSKPS